MKTRIAIILLLAAGTAMARPGKNSNDQEPPSATDFVTNLDKDNDGKVSKTEFDGPDELFTQLDKDSDGYISESEAPTGPPEQGNSSKSDGGEFVTRLDKDNDGKVSKTEFDGPDEHFSELDKNSDGYISSDEAPSGPPSGGRSGGRGGRGGRR